MIEDTKDDRSLLTHATDAFGYWVMMDMPSTFFKQVADIKQDLRRSHERRQYAGLSGV